MVQRLSPSISRTPSDSVEERQIKSDDPHVGHVILVANDNVSRGQWNYGLVEKVHVGKGSSIRCVGVRTLNGKLLQGLFQRFIGSKSRLLRRNRTQKAIQPLRKCSERSSFVRRKRPMLSSILIGLLTIVNFSSRKLEINCFLRCSTMTNRVIVF